MSLLEELIGASLDTISDEELDKAIVEGRLGREYNEAGPKTERKKKAAKVVEIDEDIMDAF